MYLVESGVIMWVFLWLCSLPFRDRIEHSRFVDKASIGLPLLWMILGTIWINLRVSEVVSLPW